MVSIFYYNDRNYTGTSNIYTMHLITLYTKLDLSDCIRQKLKF